MSKNKFLVLLALIVILLFASTLVYRDQQKKNKFSEPSVSTSKIEKIANPNPLPVSVKNTNIVKAPDDADYTYISYKIKLGDHLYGLAKKYMPTYQISGVIKEIKERNNLSSDILQLNKTITLPAEKNVLNR